MRRTPRSVLEPDERALERPYCDGDRPNDGAAPGVAPRLLDTSRRSSRARERRESKRRKGGRKAKDRSSWGAPSRDRSYAPGMLLLLFVVVALAEIVLDAAAQDLSGSAAQSAAILGAIAAVGYRFRPDMVAAGVGVLGIVALVLERSALEGATKRSLESRTLFGG